MSEEINIRERLVRIKVRKSLIEISELIMKATDVALEVKMTRERFVEAVEKFTEAYWIE